MVAERLAHQLRAAVGHAPQQRVHAREVGVAVALEHRDEARPLHLDERAHLLADELVLDDARDLGPRRRVQVELDAVGLLGEPPLGAL